MGRPDTRQVTHLSLLKQRIAGVLATSTLVGCGGQTTTPVPSSSGETSSGETSSGQASSGQASSGQASSGQASSGTTASTCSGGQKRRSCFDKQAILTKSSGYGGPPRPADAAPPPPPTRDANGCVVLDEVMDGCCNPAISGPVLEGGGCCYEFCVGACCGRPLVVGGAARVASRAPRRDWMAERTGTTTSSTDAPTRAALADAFARDALLEHASIASFAAFTLELLALGAPPELVRDAQAATADEIEHARAAFAIASGYAGAPVGPGPLDLRGIAPSSDLAAVAAACVRDGCVNETIASAIAAVQAERAEDDEVASFLSRVADDEARHAELAWRFVQWALSFDRRDVRAAVIGAFASATPSAPPLAARVDEELWRAHGRLLPAEHDAIVREVREHVIDVCRRRLLADELQAAS